METLRRIHGIAEPVRRGMEMKIVREGQWRPAVLGLGNQSNVHEDILALGGRETEVTWEDVFQGMFVSLVLRVVVLSFLPCFQIYWVGHGVGLI